MGAPVERVDARIRELDLGRSPLVRLLFRLRGMPASALRPAGMERLGFQVLVDRPGELVLGLIGRFWTPTGQLRRFDPAGFESFREPGWAKATWSFRATPLDDGRTLLETETRILCTDEASRRRFRVYWLVIRPFSGLIRRAALREIRQSAERLPDGARPRAQRKTGDR